MNDAIDNLKSKIAVLEAENSRLSERAEETLLIRLVTQSINRNDDQQLLLENVLERISILKNIPYCACLEDVDDSINVIASYAAFSDEDNLKCEVKISSDFMKEVKENSFVISLSGELESKVDIKFKPSDFIPRVALLVPFSVKTINKGFFLFVDDERDLDELNSIKMLLDQISEMLAERIDKIQLTNELSALNHELDDLIIERTRLLAKSQEIAHLGSWEYDCFANTLLWSDEVFRILGFEPQKFNPTREILQERVLEDDREKVMSKYLGFINGEYNAYNITYRIIQYGNNEIKTVNEKCSCKKDPKGNVIRFYGMIHDITRQNELEQQLAQSQKMDAIGQLAGGVAHDFNNMLAGIMGSAEILDDYLIKDPIAKETLDVIVNASERAAGLTEKLLTFARQQTTKKMSVSLHSIINDTIAILKQTIDKRININVNLKADIDIVTGDSAQLQSVFINLGINASHAMPDGGSLTFSTKKVVLSSEECELSSFEIKPGSFIEVEVFDTGTGIDKVNLTRIFEPFFTTKEQGKGTGLGLAAAHGTISKHHGTISVSSKLGRGTTFHILLPLCKEMLSEEMLENEPEHAGGTILLVDDEKSVLAVGETMLSRFGYDVIVAENGRKAVEIFDSKSDNIDLIILDMIMPEMNGRDSFYALRKIKADIPIIVASGFTHEDYIDELNNSGLNGFIQKPFRKAELSAIIAEVMNGG